MLNPKASEQAIVALKVLTWRWCRRAGRRRRVGRRLGSPVLSRECLRRWPRGSSGPMRTEELHSATTGPCPIRAHSGGDRC